MFPRRREYISKESFSEDSADSITSQQNIRKDSGASLVNDVFVAVNDEESFEEKQIYKQLEKRDSIDAILDKSEIDTVTSADLKREINEESSILDNKFTQGEKIVDKAEQVNEDEEVIISSNFIERFDSITEKNKDAPKSPPKVKIPDISVDEQIEKFDKKIESMFKEEKKVVPNTKKSIEKESFDSSLEELVTKPVRIEPAIPYIKAEQDDELDSFFDDLEPTEPAAEIQKNEISEAEPVDITLSDIEKKPADDDFENVSMEDSSITESQSFDDELDEIGKSEFIIDRSEYLTDEDIMRIKEEGNIKSGIDISDMKVSRDESFNEDDVNQLFSSKDSKKYVSSEKEKPKPIEIKKEDISDWIDE